MWLLLALLLQDAFAPADMARLPFTIALPPGAVIEQQGVSDYMTWRVRQGPETLLTIRGGVFAAPMLGMDQQTGPVRQLRNCRDGVLISRTVLLVAPLADRSLLIGVAAGRTEIADPILASIRVPGQHEGVRRSELFTCQS